MSRLPPVPRITNSDFQTEIKNDFIVIGLSALNGQVDISGDLYADHDVKVAGYLDVANNANVGGNVNVTGNANVATDLNVTGKATITAGGLEVTGPSTLNNATEIKEKLTVSSGGVEVKSGGADITGDSTITGNFNATGTTTSGGALTVSSGGANITGDSTITGETKLNTAINVKSGITTDFKTATTADLKDETKYATKVTHGIYVDAINVNKSYSSNATIGNANFVAQDGSAGISFTSGTTTPNSSLVVNAPVTINGSLTLPNGSISSETDKTFLVQVDNTSSEAKITFSGNQYGAFFILIDETDSTGATSANDGAAAIYSVCVKGSNASLNKLSGVAGGSDPNLRNITASWVNSVLVLNVANGGNLYYKVRVLSPSAFTATV